jgi:hypothetical protein
VTDCHAAIVTIRWSAPESQKFIEQALENERLYRTFLLIGQSFGCEKFGALSEWMADPVRPTHWWSMKPVR